MRNVKPAFGGPPDFFLHALDLQKLMGMEGIYLCVGMSGIGMSCIGRSNGINA